METINKTTIKLSTPTHGRLNKISSLPVNYSKSIPIFFCLFFCAPHEGSIN